MIGLAAVKELFDKLRSHHQALRYRGYDILRSGDELTVSFHLLLEPGIEFQPTLSFSAPGIDDELLAPYLFALGMVEAISYWKAACPKRVVVECGYLSAWQCEWWRDLFLHGLGEFYFQNDIDPSIPDLLSIEVAGDKRSVAKPENLGPAPHGELVLAAGGKDSSLALELLKRFDAQPRREVLILNPTRSALESVTLAGYREPLIVRRTIDKNLLALNAQGYFNGHTPFSAYLAFLGSMIGAIHGLESVIVSNERSASEENAIFHGLAVNHQYSKGIRFERRFREYAARNLPAKTSYFSFIRPLYDLQVSSLFAEFAGHHARSFRSCNVGQRDDTWCGRCPKCAFVSLTFAPFISSAEHRAIFGAELFKVPAILTAIRELTGLQDHKPFECVGTIAESRDALVLTLARYAHESTTAPLGLVAIAEELAERGVLPTTAAALETLHAWSDDHQLPQAYADKLQGLVRDIKVNSYAKS